MLKSSLLSSLLATTALAGPLTKRGAWTAPVGGKWQIVISGTPDINTPNVPVWDVDLFNTDESVIASLKSAGKKVICYFSAGTSEPDRPDGSQIRSEERGAGLPEWPGENWLDLRSENIWNIMKARIALASKKGCDAVDPDNMDGYSNQSGGGFNPPLSEDDSIAFVNKMAGEASRLGLAIGLKNSDSILYRVAGVVDFAVNEQCHEYGGCNVYDEFIKTKPVYNIEYNGRISASAACGTAGFSTVIKNMGLDQPVTYCDGVGSGGEQ